MQDRSPPTRQNLLATHGGTIHWVTRGHDGLDLRCLLYARKRTLSASARSYNFPVNLEIFPATRSNIPCFVKQGIYLQAIEFGRWLGA
jgi:hypothetical protein